MHRVLFHIGGFPVYSYGVTMVIGFIAALLFTQYRNKQLKRTSSENISDLMIWLLISGIIGARVVYVMLHANFYFTHPLSAFNLREGGLAWHGGMIFGVIALWIFAKKKKINPLDLLDLVAPAVLIGLAFGRIGCFMNGCCVGMQAPSPWGVVFKDLGDQIPRYPTQFYELILDLITAYLLVKWEPIKKFSGEIMIGMFASYSVVRFIVEILRDSPPRILGLSIAQYGSIATLILTVIWILLARKKENINPLKKR